MRISDPAIVYMKMYMDVARLKDWADRQGNEQHKFFADGLQAALQKGLPLFTTNLPKRPLTVAEKKQQDLMETQDRILKARSAPQPEMTPYQKGFAGLPGDEFHPDSHAFHDWDKGQWDAKHRDEPPSRIED
jgi:hypothetical protein